MAHSYITESEFYRYAPDAAPLLSSMRPIFGWVVHAGSVYKAFQTGTVAVLFADGEDLGAPQASLVDVDTAGEWFYDSAADAIYLQTAVNPNTQEMLAGEDHSTYVSGMIQSASRLVDSLIDATHRTPVAKDGSGEFDEVIKQATAYKLGEIIAEGREPELSDRFAARLTNGDKLGIIDGINGGWIKLASEIDADSSAGEIREIGTISGGIHLTRTYGEWRGSDHDRLKVIITTGGAPGTARFEVLAFDDATNLPKTLPLTPVGGETLRLYQKMAVGNGLHLQFDGDDGDTASVNDEWEIEVHSADLTVDHSGMTTIPAVRY